MFSFFRKSKKDSDPGRKRKDKESSASPARNHKETCKNIQNGESAPQCANASVDPSVATEVPSRNPAETETASASGGEPETKTNDDPMDVTSKVQTYANMLRTLDQPKEPRRVKPCGHGTVGIAPKTPLPGGKRDAPETPPESPKPELRNKLPFYKSPGGAAEVLHKNSPPKYELVRTQPINDTVTGVMKLRVDIPSSPPATPDSTPPIDAEKYVIGLKRGERLLF